MVQDEKMKMTRPLDKDEYLTGGGFFAKGIYEHKHTDMCDTYGIATFLSVSLNQLYIAFSGCNQMWISDGNWKLQYSVCMFQVCFKGNWYTDGDH